MNLSSCVAVAVDLDDFLSESRRSGAAWARRTRSSVDSVVRGARCADAVVRTQPPDAWIITIHGEPDAIAAQANTLAFRLRNDIAAETTTTASIGISRVLVGCDSAPEAARQAQATLGKKTIGGAGKIYPTTEHRPFDPPDITAEVVASLREGNAREATARVQRWIELVLLRQASPDVVLGVWLPALILDLTITLDPRRAADGSPDWRSTLAHTRVADLADLASIHERSHLHEWLSTRMARLATLAVTDRPSKLIVRAENLLRAQFADPELSLSSAAVDLAVSPYHLAHVFRRERDTTFRRQLTGVRVRTAVSMLGKGGYTVGEVGRRCGFSTTRQFRATLRRETGNAPTALLRTRC
jgi:AraC-like DNA-binding protein